MGQSNATIFEYNQQEKNINNATFHSSVNWRHLSAGILRGNLIQHASVASMFTAQGGAFLRCQKMAFRKSFRAEP